MSDPKPCPVCGDIPDANKYHATCFNPTCAIGGKLLTWELWNALPRYAENRQQILDLSSAMLEEGAHQDETAP